jgi:hypothetical protein
MVARRRGGPGRLETFSDAVFALAATLLVVSLEVPVTFDELLVDLSGFGAFAVGFAALVLIWTVHTAYFRRYGLQDGWTVTFSFANGQTVTQAWNSVITQSASQVTARNASYNAAVAPGASVSFGFNGAHTGTNTDPAEFTVNGTACI